MSDNPNNTTVIEFGICTCNIAPMGDGGMEGYEEKKMYRYQFVTDGKKKWYRIYHDNESNYYETTGNGKFKKYFKKNFDQ